MPMLSIAHYLGLQVSLIDLGFPLYYLKTIFVLQVSTVCAEPEQNPLWNTRYDLPSN